MLLVKRLGLIFFTTALLGACSGGDIGQECTGFDVPNPGTGEGGAGSGQSQGSEIVEVNVEFPCESLTCVATVGRGGYCSRECGSDSNCPKGFTCASVTLVGQFKDQTFCRWAECESNDDCGGGQICELVDELSLGTDVVKQCKLE